MALDFPSSPGVGQVVTIGGVTWTWDGVKWTAVGTGSGIYLPFTGGTMTGDLILNRDAQVALGAATFEQVNARGAGDNRIINGDFRIDQRNNGASGTANGYTVDRWQYVGSQASKLTWQRATGPATIGFPYALWLTSSSAYTALAADSFFLNQTIEADMVSDLAWGTVSAQSATLSFWVLATVAGAYSGAIVNQPAPPTRCYPFTFSLLAGTWTKVVIPIPGDTAGTWVMSGNAGGVAVKFDLGSGSNFRGAAGAWVNGNLNGVTGAAALVATNGAALGVTGVKLEIGSVATPYNRQSLAKSMADCQRYFQKLGGTSADVIIQAYAPGAGAGYASTTIGISAMRAAPTAVRVGTWTLTNNSATGFYPGISSLGVQINATAAGAASLVSADATTYITLSAEL